jgi:hypothetical protein
VSALTTLMQDNSGNVTFAKGEGVTQFEIFFGDATTSLLLLILAGHFINIARGI